MFHTCNLSQMSKLLNVFSSVFPWFTVRIFIVYKKIETGACSRKFPQGQICSLLSNVLCYPGCFGNSYSFSLCIMSHAKLCGHFTRQRIGSSAPTLEYLKMQLLVILILLSAEMHLLSVQRYNCFGHELEQVNCFYFTLKEDIHSVPRRYNSYFIACRNASISVKRHFCVGISITWTCNCFNSTLKSKEILPLSQANSFSRRFFWVPFHLLARFNQSKSSS